MFAAFFPERALVIVVEAATVPRNAALLAFAHIVHFLVLAVFEVAEASSLGAEVLVVPLEYDIFAELTFYGSVEDGDFDGWGESDFLHIVVLRGDNPGVVTREDVLEFVTDEAV